LYRYNAAIVAAKKKRADKRDAEQERNSPRERAPVDEVGLCTLNQVDP
jgi:hypothetical protein